MPQPPQHHSGQRDQPSGQQPHPLAPQKPSSKKTLVVAPPLNENDSGRSPPDQPVDARVEDRFVLPPGGFVQPGTGKAHVFKPCAQAVKVHTLLDALTGALPDTGEEEREWTLDSGESRGLQPSGVGESLPLQRAQSDVPRGKGVLREVPGVKKGSKSLLPQQALTRGVIDGSGGDRTSMENSPSQLHTRQTFVKPPLPSGAADAPTEVLPSAQVSRTGHLSTELLTARGTRATPSDTPLAHAAKVSPMPGSSRLSPLFTPSARPVFSTLPELAKESKAAPRKLPVKVFSPGTVSQGSFRPPRAAGVQNTQSLPGPLSPGASPAVRSPLPLRSRAAQRVPCGPLNNVRSGHKRGVYQRQENAPRSLAEGDVVNVLRRGTVCTTPLQPNLL